MRYFFLLLACLLSFPPAAALAVDDLPVTGTVVSTSRIVETTRTRSGVSRTIRVTVRLDVPVEGSIQKWTVECAGALQPECFALNHGDVVTVSVFFHRSSVPEGNPAVRELQVH